MVLQPGAILNLSSIAEEVQESQLGAIPYVYRVGAVTVVLRGACTAAVALVAMVSSCSASCQRSELIFLMHSLTLGGLFLAYASRRETHIVRRPPSEGCTE